MRLETHESGIHNITIPQHKELRTGTLSAVLSDVAKHLNRTKVSIMADIF